MSAWLVRVDSRPRSVERFHELCVLAVARLPFGLNSLVAPTFLGFVLLNGATFALDLLLLTGLHGGVGMPLPVAVALAYACAFMLSYFLNRTLNFRSHAAVGPQFAVYVVVVVVNTWCSSWAFPACCLPSASNTTCRGSWPEAAKRCTCTARCGGWSSGANA